jgi:hypothetical protein
MLKEGSAEDLSPDHLTWWVEDAIAFYVERLRIESATRASEVRTGAPGDITVVAGPPADGTSDVPAAPPVAIAITASEVPMEGAGT